MTGPAERICSLLPSATEIVYALGLEDRLVGVTHECDFPPRAQSKPHLTTSIIEGDGLSAAEIDAQVRESLDADATIYHLDGDLLDRLAPDLILTQDLCHVCAVGPGEVEDVLCRLSRRPDVVSLEPRTLLDVMDSILTVGRLTGALRTAIGVTDALRERLQRVHDTVAGRPPVSVLTMEWTDPLFVGGHWVPEMVGLAGGIDVLGRAGEPSRVASWDDVAACAPDVVIAMPCGFGLDRSREELQRVVMPNQWWDLPAVRNDRVYVVDGSSYFNRPGPRLVDGVEILASILHPDAWESAPDGSWAHFESVTAVTASGAKGQGLL